ncbi:MAG: alpha/beta fold hydrolase [Pseudonocardia sp.]
MRVRFLATSTGARIAFAVLGAGSPLVLVPPWTSHLEALWEIEGHRRLCTRLAEQHTVVMYDRWGCGLSDRARDDLSQDADVQVLADLVAHLKLRRVALYGPSAGGHVALRYADRHPRTVSHLVLFGMTVEGRPARTPTWLALRELILADFPVAARAIAAVLLAGAGTPEQETFARLMLAGSTPEMTVALLNSTDSGEVADRVAVPTLVAIRRGDPLTPPEVSRRLATRMPRAELLLLDGDAHVHYLGDVDAFADAVLAFLARGRAPAGPVGTLTGREREVLDLVAAGLTNAAIAERLVLSVRTVERHTLNIYAKLGVRGRAEAVAVGFAGGGPSGGR